MTWLARSVRRPRAKQADGVHDLASVVHQITYTSITHVDLRRKGVMTAGKEWLALLQYAVVAVQGSAVAQANLAWLLEHSSAYEAQYKAKACMRLLAQAGKGGLADAWVDAGNMEYRGHQLRTPLCPPPRVCTTLQHLRLASHRQPALQQMHSKHWRQSRLQIRSRTDTNCCWRL